MQSNFGLDNMLFEVETVMSNINDEEPSPFLELVALEGDMIGNTILIGEFRRTDVEYDNGDGQLQFSVSFMDLDKKQNDELLEKHIDTINKIVMNIIESVVEDENFK